MARSISSIGYEIKRLWTKPYFGAVPYIDAMCQLESVDDFFGYDSARSIINYFLANARTWHGEDARSIKKELKEMLK